MQIVDQEDDEEEVTTTAISPSNQNVQSQVHNKGHIKFSEMLN